MNRLARRCRILSAFAAVIVALAAWQASLAQPAGSPAPAAAAARNDGSSAYSPIVGGGQNLLLVVNPNSPASLTVANHYALIRGIPAVNIVSIPFKLDRLMETTDLETFRTVVLTQVLNYIKERKLDHIDTIVYSADFPSAVAFGNENSGNVGSINGLTFLYQSVLADKQNDFLSMTSNQYFILARPTDKKDAKGNPLFNVEDPTAFSSAKSYGQPGQKYYLSMMLGVTSGRGNSVTEVVDGLKRAAAADGANPKGTWYYMFDGNIRTNIREWGFASAIAKLESIGQKAKQDNTPTPTGADRAIAIPKNKVDILGAMIGHQFPNPPKSGSKVMPGGLVDNLTSFGGAMSWAEGQVPISALIRFGSAGAAGTVTEPGGTQIKFPTPFLFYYYAKGATLAESYYLSVQMPYQILMLGDPLCQPFAKLPKIEGVTAGQIVDKLGGILKAVAPEGVQCQPMEFFIDGLPAHDPKVVLGDGYHEVLAAAQCNVPLQWQSSVRFGLVQGKAMDFTASSKEVIFGKGVKLSAAMPGAMKIEFLHLGRILKSVDSARADVEIDSTQLGMGPARLYARATIGDKTNQAVPLIVDVKAPPMIAAAKFDEKTPMSAGALVTGPGIEPYVATDMRKVPALHNAKVAAGQPWRIDGYVTAPADDLYQFQVWFDGKVTLKVDGQPIALPEGKDWRFAPLSLAKGRHLFAFECPGAQTREIDIRFGGPGSRSLGTANSQYPSAATKPAK